MKIIYAVVGIIGLLLILNGNWNFFYALLVLFGAFLTIRVALKFKGWLPAISIISVLGLSMCLLILIGFKGCIEAIYNYPNRDEIKYGDIKLCKDTEGFDVFSLTDSEGIFIREYYRLWSKTGWNDSSVIRQNKRWSGRTGNIDFHSNKGGYGFTGILGFHAQNQNVRLYRDSEPFTGRAKLCVDSFKVEAIRYPSRRTYWMNKKKVILEEMDVVDGWLDGEFIQYEYNLSDDWKTVKSFKKVKKFKNGARHELVIEKNNDGAIWIKGNIENGLKQGFWKEGDDKGEYLNGDKIGVWVGKRNYEGKEYVDKIYYENGEKVDLKTYLNGKEVK